MATGRPVVSIYQFDNPSERTGTLPMPHALTMPLRPDLVNYVHTNMSKNKRQAYAVGAKVGYDTAAESWGTGRAVARIPRAPGGGTHRAGQGAFGNMCRGGGMFSPTKIWRRWHRKINVQEKRIAVVSALSASCLPPLVMARGHKIDDLAELPLVLSDGIESIQKTKQAIEIFKKLGCEDELQRIIDSKKIRPGKGKMRNRRYKMKLGPIVIYKEDNGIVRAMRNIPGVETACVTHLNLLKLAPGGTFGRFLIWTESAFKFLHAMYGTLKSGAPLKKGFTLPKAAMENADIARIINSDEVQSVLRPKKEAPKKYARKINPLKSMKAMALLNPHARQRKAAAKRALQDGTQEHKDVQAKKKKRQETAKAYNKKFKKGDETFYKTMMKAFETKPDKEEAEEENEADEE
eukprot:CAMPEP_0172928742 /NCGR_PEP_ID=MMETSP1075-20121228/218131_1 /TAXON_ID=2916 /ORGANISM="Ceratium fusus, Strain PA161109" /LENGTH=405 /DNA_ID=CAMNT_0013790029 /DNA_START=38 /DNA_END=1255 /DNA_ORIENTATION=-